MRNAGLDEAQGGIKIVERNSNHLRYTDDTTLIAEMKEELKSPLIKVNGKCENVGLECNIQKSQIMASGPITWWLINGETMERVTDSILWSSKISAGGDCSYEIRRRFSLEENLCPNLGSILKSRDILCL